MDDHKSVPMKHFTHKGWFGVCPVYLGELDTPIPLVEPRHPSLDFLLTFSEIVYRSIFWVCISINHEYEASWPIRITGELKGKRSGT